MSYGAVGIVENSHPFMLNGLGEGGNPFLTDLFNESDIVLALETDWRPDQQGLSHRHVIQTAKLPTAFGDSLPMDVGIIGDTTEIIKQMIQGLQSYTGNPLWIDRIQHCKQSWTAQNEIEGNHAQSPLHPSSIIRAVERSISGEAIITLDEGDSTLWFLRNFRAQQQQVLLSNRWRTMGFGLPAALAAKLCFPHKQVVCITGDGGLCMVLADLLTAKRYGLAITVIVFNNSTLQMEHDKMLMKGLQPEGTSLTNPDFTKVAAACGWSAHGIASLEQLEAALNAAKTSDVPVLLDILTEQIAYPDFQTAKRRPNE